LAPHPKGPDTNDNSGKFEALMDQIEGAKDDQERVVHYRNALSMVTDNRLGAQGMKIADVALLLT
jgi:hypothetical protein